MEAYRVYPQERSDEIARHADGIAWKLQGADPLARVMVVVSLNLLDPVLDAMERAAGPAHVASAARRHPVAQSASRIAWPRSPSNIRICRIATSSSASCMTDANLIDRRHAQLALFREAEKSYEVEHRRARGPLAAPPAGPLHAAIWRWRDHALTPGYSTWPSRRAASWTTTTAGKSGRRPAAIRQQKTASDLETVQHLGRGSLARHQAHPAAPPPAQRQAAAASRRPEAAQEGEDSRRMGRAAGRQQHLLLSAGRPGDRGLRPLPEEERQEHSIGRARRAWSHSPLRCWMASICARPSATGTKARSTCASSRRSQAKWAR